MSESEGPAQVIAPPPAEPHLPSARSAGEQTSGEVGGSGEGVGELLSESSKSHWNSLELVKVLIAAAVPISVFVAGAAISNSTKQQEEVRAKWDAIGQLSRSALERRSRSELLASAIRRHAAAASDASLAEVSRRKQAYDESYVEWNANVGRHMLALRRASDAKQFTQLESKLQRSLVNATFGPLDACLTVAYDQVIRSRNLEAVAALDSCNTRKLLQDALDCSYEISDEAFTVAADVGIAQQPSPGRSCPPPRD